MCSVGLEGEGRGAGSIQFGRLEEVVGGSRGGVRLLFLFVLPPRELECVRVGADAAQRVALVSFGWGESRLKWSVVLLALLLSGSLALLSNTCASACSHEGTAGAAISGLVRRLFWVFFLYLVTFLEAAASVKPQLLKFLFSGPCCL